jgi:hypothetical protein
MTDNSNDQNLAREAKAIVALAFRNGPIEDIHSDEHGGSRISGDEMTLIMKNAVNCVYKLLRLRSTDPDRYEREMAYGERCAAKWDDPD